MQSDSRKRDEFLRLMAVAADPAIQDRLRAQVRDLEDYHSLIFQAFVRNPFLRLHDEEKAFVSSGNVTPGVRELLSARAAAARSRTPRYIVFAMPKSGSSFVQSAVKVALNLPFLSMTTISPPELSSGLGLNSREQELDDLALVNAALCAPRGFVAQAHTRYSPYLGAQLDLYGVTPIVTVRNVLDCIVSFDDMMLNWRKRGREHGSRPFWYSDAQFLLPEDYPELPPARRYMLLGHTYGTWLIAFYLTWKRGIQQGAVAPLVIRYERDVLNPERLISQLSSVVRTTPEQQERLAGYVRAPNKTAARINIGRAGRGLELIPPAVVDFLMDYIGAFRNELSDEEVAFLLR